jgi:preprotein translocase subunit SecF
MSITKYRKTFIGIALGLSFISLALIGKYGIEPGIDFTGGTVMEISYKGEDVLQKNRAEIESRGVKVFVTEDKTYRLISTDNYDSLKSELENYLTVGTSTYTVLGVSDVGPSLGGEMKQKAIIAIVIASLAILLFIAFSFRKVSEPVASWKYGIASLVTLLHDILIPTGVYAILSHYYGAEVDTLFIVALLTILGISVSDKIVVFDRIRENLALGHKKSFAEIVDISLKQTFTRSINTSLTVVFSLLVLALYGPTATVFFSITLIVGMIVGTYSSIFVASTLLTFFTKK